ncbi:putative F-box protein At5g04010 [Bidens hawaiensis]|uniref:putative F-box protein At5g04010 n=1 Tax=Bidens hawaiensis TaxID=980011 RepID=UPI004049FFB5
MSNIPWEVLVLVANNLDPKTLAIASCVSKPWCSIMTLDHLWEHLCTKHFPSLTHLRSAVPTLAYHRLYNLGFTSTKRRKPPPPTPRITLKNLLFIITLNTTKSAPVTIIKPGAEVAPDSKSLFRFDFDVLEHNKWLKFDVNDETRVTWNVVLNGFEGVFTMMDCKGRGSFFSGSDGWFSAELPVAGCCCGGGSSGMVAEMRLAMREEEGGDGRRVVVGSVGVGVLSVVSWRYVCVDDGLRYLQHFLEPSH